MRTVLVGDSCAGKTTLLSSLAQLGYWVVFEEGWKKIPPAIEKNKSASNRWFINYFLERDKENGRKNGVWERCLEFQFPFTEAQYRAGKITVSEYEAVKDLLSSQVKKVSFSPETFIIHLTCSADLIQRRLQERLGHMADQGEYWSILRHETEKYFERFPHYYKIDTTYLKPDEVLGRVLAIIKPEN